MLREQLLAGPGLAYQEDGQPAPSELAPPSPLNCAFAVFNFAVTGVSDVLFFTGFGVGIKLSLAAENLAVRGALRYAGGASEIGVARVLYSGARVLRGEAGAAFQGAADGVITGVPANIGRGLITGISPIDFIPGIASYRAFRLARQTCTTR